MSDALIHIEAAIKALTVEAYRSTNLNDWEPVETFTIAEELDRVDCAIGPRGTSMFSGLAHTIREAHTELIAARNALKEGR